MSFLSKRVVLMIFSLLNVKRTNYGPNRKYGPNSIRVRLHWPY